MIQIYKIIFLSNFRAIIELSLKREKMSLLKKCVAEAIGTAILVFCPCGVAAWTNGNVIATSLAFGLVIVGCAYSIGNISIFNINRAVSLEMFRRKKK